MTDPAQSPPEAAPDADLSGHTLGDYRLLRRLGRGGMAEVYLADQGSLRRQVALKVLKTGLASDDVYVKRFHQEAQAAAALVHANIVQVYEVGRINGVHYIAQEYVQGYNLRELLVRQGPPDARLAIRIMRQAAAALYRASERGIVHRDIKPENIMLTRNGEVKVADFGLARVTRDGDALNLTQVGVTMGTPLYMSPEQVEGKPIDHRSDLYSLGVTCYHMLTGAPPFRGETALSVAVQHLKSQPERLENLRPDLPTALCRIVHKTLEKDASHRYNSARELLRDLRALQIDDEEDGLDDDEELLGAIDDDLCSRIEATQRLDSLMRTAALELHRPSKKPWIYLALGLVAAVFLGGAVALATRRPSVFSNADAIETHIEKQPSARAQYLYAKLFNTQAHWMSVLQHYPGAEIYVRQAKRELALLYLQENDLEAAGAIFNEFATLSDVEHSLRAFGLAGQCVVYSYEGKHKDALAKAVEVRSLSEKTPGGLRLDSRMERLFRHAYEASMKALNRERNEQFDEWLEESLPSDES